MQQRAELIGYAWVVVGDPDTAEDVFQEVSVAAIRKADEIKDVDHLQAWLFKAVRLQGLKARRGTGPKVLLLSDEVLEAVEQARVTDDSFGPSERLDALRKCVGKLKGVSRNIVELRYGQNLKPAEIAERTGKNIQTVYKTITRSHATLRDCMKQVLNHSGTSGRTPGGTSGGAI